MEVRFRARGIECVGMAMGICGLRLSLNFLRQRGNFSRLRDSHYRRRARWGWGGVSVRGRAVRLVNPFAAAFGTQFRTRIAALRDR